MNYLCLLLAVLVCLSPPAGAQEPRQPHWVYDGTHPNARWYDLLLFSCDVKDQRLRITTTTGNGSSNRPANWKDGFEPLKQPLLECGDDAWNVRVKFVKSRNESQGACSEQKFVSLWINEKKILKKIYFGCPRSPGYQYYSSHLIYTQLEVNKKNATFCQLGNRCEDFNSSTAIWDKEEYVKGLLWHEKNSAYQLISFDPSHKEICQSYSNSHYPTQPQSTDAYSQSSVPDMPVRVEGVTDSVTYYDPTPDDPKAQRYFIRPQKAHLELLNADLNGDGREELVILYGHTAGRLLGYYQRSALFENAPFAGEKNKSDIVERFLACDTTNRAECEFKQTPTHEWDHDSFPRQVFSSRHSRLDQIGNLYVFHTYESSEQLFEDSAIISTIRRDFSLKHICHFERVHPNF